MLATSRLQRLLLLALVLLLAAIAAILTNRPGSSPAPSAAHRSPFDGPILPPGLRAGNFALQDQNGRRITLSSYRGHVVVLTFIHSECHDTCPFMVEQIKGALNLLPGSGSGVPALGISVAPGEDTMAHRRRFLAKHDMTRRLAFLNGPRTSMRAVWHAYAIQPVQGPMDHSTFVLLIDRHGIERVGFPADQLTPEALAHDIRVLQREA
jgi:protein SCO1